MCNDYIEFLDSIITRLKCNVCFINANEGLVNIIKSLESKVKELQEQKDNETCQA